MNVAAELGRNPITSKHSGMEMSRLTLDGTAEPVSRDQILRRQWGQGNTHFPCSADHEQDWQPYPVSYLSFPFTPAGWTQTVEVTEETVRVPGVL